MNAVGALEPDSEVFAHPSVNAEDGACEVFTARNRSFSHSTIFMIENGEPKDVVKSRQI
jgi:hypothetical protein